MCEALAPPDGSNLLSLKSHFRISRAIAVFGASQFRRFFELCQARPLRANLSSISYSGFDTGTF